MTASLTRRKAPVTAGYNYIPQEYVENLKRYKYASSDSSILSRFVLQHYWNFVVGLVPMTIAPNMITLTGLAVGMSSNLLQLYYFFFNDAVYPAWSWYYAAFALFAYQTLDAIDGKQARRTGTGSPLGELFDHGCDAFLTPFVQITVSLALRMSPVTTYVFLLQSSLGLFAAIWEQFSTGMLDLGYLSGPTEGILLLCGIFLVTAIGGGEFWSRPLIPAVKLTAPESWSAALGMPIDIKIETAAECLFYFFTLMWCITVFNNFFHGLVRPTVHSSRFTAIKAAVPTLMIIALHVALFLHFPEVHRSTPYAFELSLGLLMSFTVTRLTVARLCAMPYRCFNTQYLLHLIVCVGALVGKFTNVVETAVVEYCLSYAMIVLTALGVVFYGFMIVNVFRQIARYLGVDILSITRQKKD